MISFRRRPAPLQDSPPVADSGPAGTPAIPGHGWHVLLILSLLMGFASISTDVYLPAIPAMAHALRVPVSTIELTVSGYQVGFSLG